MANRKKIFNTTVIASGLAVVGFFMLIIFIQRQQLERGFERQRVKDELNVVRTIGNSLENTINQSFAKLALVADFEEIQSGDTKVCSAKLTEVFSLISGGLLDTMSRMRSDGIFDCSTTPTTPGFDGKVFPHLRKIISDPNHKAVVGDIALSSTEGRAFTSLHHPIFNDNGVFLGTIGTALYFDEFGREFVDPIRGAAESEFVFIMDQQGKLLYSNKSNAKIAENYLPDPSRKVQRKIIEDFKAGKLTKEIDSQVAHVDVLAYKKIKVAEGTEWIVIAATSRQSLNTLVNQGTLFGSFTNMSVVAITIGVMSIGAIYALIKYTNRKLFAPIALISKTTEQIGDGEYDARVNLSKFPEGDEFRILASSINNMAEDIQKSYTELEKKVKERTKELDMTNKKLNDKLAESQKLTNMMTGRELKMAELKTKLAELKDKTK